MDVRIMTTPPVNALGIRRYELGNCWAEVGLNRAFSVNPRNYTVTASHGIPAPILERLKRRGGACYGSGYVYNLTRTAALRLAAAIVCHNAREFGLRAA